MSKYPLVWPVTALVIFGSVSGQEITWRGFVQTNYSFRTARINPQAGQPDLLLADQRFQLRLSGSEKQARLFAKLDFLLDALKNKANLEIRESFLDYRWGNFDFRVGRQIITWGTGDLLFINDLFPKDWQAFFTGRPIEYLKIGANGVKTTFYTWPFSVEVVILPVFESDNLPAPENFFIFDPFAAIANRSEEKPKADFENIEEALRLYRTFSGFELTAYLYRGFYRFPAVKSDSLPAKVLYFFPRLSVYGLSVQKNLFNGILNTEYGYYDSRQDRRGDNPMISNSFHKFLAGYQRQAWTDFTCSVQYYGEYMTDFGNYRNTLPVGFPSQKHLRQLFTIRATQFLKYQTLKLSLFGFYSSSDQDYYVIPEAQYKVSDKVWTTIGGNVFGGEKQTTFLGQLDKNDNFYLTIRYEF